MVSDVAATAAHSMASNDVERALEGLKASLAALQAAQASLNEEQRQSVRQTARQVVAAVTKPAETISYFAQEIGSQRMAIRVGIDLKLFRILSEAQRAVSLAQLAEQTGAESALLVRILRSLTTTGFVDEVDTALYAATLLTHTIAEPAMEGAIVTCYDGSSRVQSTLHLYFQEHGYKIPLDHADCAFQWTFQTRQTYFDYIHADPARISAFNTFMTRIRSTRRHWTEWYPIEAQLMVSNAEDKGKMLLVDMGGGYGHDLEIFLARFPTASGRLMLQDLPQAIQNLTGLSTGIQAMVHDIFQRQPVTGARAYYTHFVLHDWPDEKCREILRNILPAMEPGYSKIFLNETVLPDRDCPPVFAAMDLNMMSIIAGMERTAQEWTNLVESVGLQVVSIRVSPFPGDSEGVIEAIRPAS